MEGARKAVSTLQGDNELRSWNTRFIVLLLCTSACSCRNRGTPPNLSILGAWRVEKVLCSDCRGPVLNETGKTLEFTRNYIKNPVGGNCDFTPGYALLRPQPSKQILSQTRGLLPPEAVRALTDAKDPEYGFITCDGMNYAQIAILSGTAALYFGEDQVVFQLSR